MTAHDERLPWSGDVGRAGRALVRDRLGGLLSPERLEEAELLVTELGTNAFAHALPLDGGTVGLRIEVDDEGVRLVLIDGGRDLVPSWEEPSHARIGGGLFVVDSVATAWGVSDDGVNAVWAELAWE